MTLNLPHPDPFGIGPFCRFLRGRRHGRTTRGSRLGRGRTGPHVGKAVAGFGLIQKGEGSALGEGTFPTGFPAAPRLHLLPNVDRRRRDAPYEAEGRHIAIRRFAC